MEIVFLMICLKWEAFYPSLFIVLVSTESLDFGEILKVILNNANIINIFFNIYQRPVKEPEEKGQTVFALIIFRMFTE